MRLSILATDAQKEELLKHGVQPGTVITWTDRWEDFSGNVAGAYIDLQFEPSAERMALLEQLSASPVIINSMSPVPSSKLVRINAWPGFLERPVIEAACRDESLRPAAEAVFAAFSRATEWTPDVPGFVTARVVAMIINEAYFALAEEVSTVPGIDTGMKTGTNYPYGPFEWAERIGLEKISALLAELSALQPRYEVAALLKKEMTA